MKRSKFSVLAWMTASLGLSGNELVAYAYLYEVTADGTKPYDGGYTELSEVMGTTIPTVYNTLKKLKERGFLEDDGGARQDAKVIRVVPRQNLKVA